MVNILNDLYLRNIGIEYLCGYLVRYYLVGLLWHAMVTDFYGKNIILAACTIRNFFFNNSFDVFFMQVGLGKK